MLTELSFLKIQIFILNSMFIYLFIYFGATKKNTEAY